MRVRMLIVCAVLMAAGSAQAAILGSWTTEDAGGGMDRLILTVTPTAGETMAGFDILIYDPLWGSNFAFATNTLFNATKNASSSFLLNESHTVANPTPPPPTTTVADLTVQVRLQETYAVGGAFAANGVPGAYAAGWSSPLQLAEIIVPHGAFASPLTQLVVSKSDWTGPYALASKPDGTLMNIQMVPEPGTLALLASGAIGLLVFAWRRRK